MRISLVHRLYLPEIKGEGTVLIIEIKIIV